MVSFKAEVTSKEIIKPSSPTPPHLKTLQLSFIDQFQPSVHVPLLFFYQNEPTHDPIDHAERSSLLKKSLSDTLVRFYPLAGRIKDKSSIDCNDEGVEFYEANVSSNLSEVIEKPNLEDLKGLLPFEPTAHDRNLIFGVQVNHFSCGGMAIGVCFSHKIADGIACTIFMRAWATMARGVPNGDHDHMVANQNFNAASYFPPRDNVNGTQTKEVPLRKEKIVTRRFVFNKKMIDALKEQFLNTVDGPQATAPTNAEVVTAFIWKLLMKAEAQGTTHNPNLAKTSFAVVSVDLRPRMAPPIPADCSFGNFSWFRFTDSVSVRDCEPEHFKLVPMLREAEAKIDANYIKNLQCGHEQNQTEVKKGDNTGIVQMCCFTSVWCDYPIYEVNFGWGKPTWVCTVSIPFKNLVMLMGTRCGEGIEAWMHMVEEDMVILERDVELLSLAS